MERRLDIVRPTKLEIRNKVAEMITASAPNLRDDRIDPILQMLESIDIDKATYPPAPAGGSIFTEEILSNFLDSIFLDHSIMYSDLYKIEEYLEAIESIFESTVVSLLNRSEIMVSKVRNIATINTRPYTCTDFYHNSLKDEDATLTPNRTLRVNPDVGMISLNHTRGENICTKAKSDVFIEILSEGCNIIDNNDINNVYLHRSLTPAYVTVLSNSEPENSNYGVLDIENIEGMVYDIVIRFPNVVSVNSIALDLFTNSPANIEKIYYSSIDKANWNPVYVTEIPILDKEIESNNVEINFDRVFAKELHILVSQANYQKVETDIVTDKYIQVRDYIKHIKNSLYQISTIGISPNESIESNFTKIKLDMIEYIQNTTNTIKEGNRLYCCGLYNIYCGDKYYDTYGIFTGNDLFMNGNLVNINLEWTGPTTQIIDDIPHSTTIIDIQGYGVDISLGKCSDDIKLFDPSPDVNEYMPTIVDIGEILKVDNRLIVRTNFIPEYANEIYTYIVASGDIVGSGEVIPYDENTYISRNSKGLDIELDEIFSDNNSIYPGMTIPIWYLPAKYDFNGRRYTTDYVDIIERAGRPNIDNNNITGVLSQYYYTYSGDTFFAYNIINNPKVLINDIEYYQLGVGQGEDYNSLHYVQNNNGNLYVNSNHVVGPVDDFYCGIIDDIPEYKDESGTYQYTTKYDYMKGTIKLFHRPTGILLDIIEYGDSSDSKDVFAMISYYDPSELSVSYIPISTDATILPEFKTNILQYNTEKAISINGDRIELPHFPHIDFSILRSESFTYNKGIFSLNYSYSVTYEPINVTVNGSKATDITEYKTGEIPMFPESRQDNEYYFYLYDNNKLVFNKEIEGVVDVKYYRHMDRMKAIIRMITDSRIRTDITPEIWEYSLAMNIKRL